MIKQTVVTSNLKINTRNLFEYDIVLGTSIMGMPSTALNNKKHVQEWTTENLETINRYSIIKSCIPIMYEGYYILNGLYHFVANQNLLVKRNGFWSWRLCETLIEGDCIFVKDKEEPVLKIEQVKERCTIHAIETECNDVIYINDVLVYSGARDAN